MSVTTPLGQILRDEDGMRLEFHRSYDTPIDDVWSALTDQDRVARWFGTWTGDPGVGHLEIVMTAEDDPAPQRATILHCAPPTRLVLEMPSPDGTWQLSVDLRAHGDGTTLVFCQRLSRPYDATSIGPGWHFYLDRLGAVIAGTPVPAAWDDYYPSLCDSYLLPA